MSRKFLLTLTLGVSMLLPCLPATATVKMLDRVIAVVEDGIIMESELNSRIATLKLQLSRSNTSLPPEAKLRERVLESLVLEHIQLQMAERAGVRVEEERLNAAVESIASKNQMTLAEFQQALEKEGISYAAAREQIRREMLISEVQQNQIGSRITISDREVMTYLNREGDSLAKKAEFHLGHILIALPENPSEAAVKEAEEKVEQIYQELQAGAEFRQMAVARSDGRNALKGGVIGWRKGGELPALFSDIILKLKVGEISRPVRSASGFHLVKVFEKRGIENQVIEETHVRHILIKPNAIRSEDEAEALAETLHQRITAGEAFEILAKEYSDDPMSVVGGGDLDWIRPGLMVPEFEKVMVATPPGQLSKPFRTRFGWHILEAMDRRTRNVGQEMQESVARQALHRYKYESELQSWLREIREQAYVEIRS